MIFKQWFIKNKALTKSWIILISVTLVFTVLQTGSSNPQKVKAGSIDTYIPEGFVLLPIEIINASAIQGLLKARAVVDLYTSDPIQFQAQKVAEAVKIIRSPNNDSHFAALIPENEVHLLIKRFKPFYVVIQNPKKTGTKIQPVQRKIRRSIIIELEESPSF